MSKRKRKPAKSRQPTEPERPLLNEPPTGTARNHAKWFITAFLLVNILVPLKWYVGRAVGWDVDERFCWRMFSAYSMRRTQIALWETVEEDGRDVEKRISLPTIMQPGWAEVLQKYQQPALVEHVLREHCRQTDATSVRFERTGNWSDGTPIERYRMSVDCHEP